MPAAPASDTPRFDVSIVTAVYNVARYLPEFIASLEAQVGVDLARIEVVAVDDGSTDSSPDLLRSWQARTRMAVTVLTKENGGQGSARNLGLTVASGRWVTFTDPDDQLERHYLARVLAFAAKHPETELIATARWMHNESTGAVTDTHPLRYMFKQDQLLDLDAAPDYFHGSAPAAFFRRDRLLAHDTRFDDRIRPNFEDGYFCVRYLLTCDRPLVGFVKGARYIYRKRSDGSSTLNNSVAQPTRYTVVPRRGYLDVLQRAKDAHGSAAPRWLQNFVLYELSWYFTAEASMAESQTAAIGDVAREFIANLRDIVALLDPDAIEQFSLRVFDSAWRDALLHGIHGKTWHAPYAVIGPLDPHRRLLRVIHRFTGPEPRIEIRDGDRVVTPTHTKLRAHTYFDQDLVTERINWVPASDDLTTTVDGRVVPLRDKWPRPEPNPVTKVRKSQLQRWGRWLIRPHLVALVLTRRLLGRLLTLGPIGGRYRDAWVLMDRIHDADDSAEHLFHYLRIHRPDIDCYFVVERGTPDWIRLRPEAGSRLVAHGSARWVRLMLNCRHLISSHVDKPVHRPAKLMAYLWRRSPQWSFSFLQHGIIKDDLSRWLNPKALDLFVTSTPGEFASVVGDGTQYVYTTRETKLTGLPRFDRLLAAADKVPPAERRLLLVAPTWRTWLVPPLAEMSQRRTVREDFLETEYAQQWLGLLCSPELAALATEHGLQLGFLPHPNLQSVLPLLDLPTHITPLGFIGNNVQELFARAAMLVTDYSSMAFNVAYLDRPVVYFQFDAEAMFSGGHVGRRGYFDYETQGLGPVVETLPEALAAITAVAGRGCALEEEFARRIADTFVVRDGRCCERVIAAIEAIRPAAVSRDV